LCASVLSKEDTDINLPLTTSAELEQGDCQQDGVSTSFLSLDSHIDKMQEIYKLHQPFLKESPEQPLSLYNLESLYPSLAINITSILPKPLPIAITIGNTPSHHRYKDREKGYMQGELSTCVSFATVACLEWTLYPNVDRKLSEGHLTHVAETTDDCKPGLDLVTAMSVARDTGVVEAQYWPYSDQHVCYPNPPSITDKPHYKFSAVYPLFQKNREEVIALLKHEMSASTEPTFNDDKNHPHIMSLKLAIANNYPVVVSVPVIGSVWYTGTADRIQRKEVENWFKEVGDAPKNKGWHAIMIYGYNDNDGKKTFEFKNSWGPSWGHCGPKVVVQGHGHLTYDFIIKYAEFAMYGIK